MKDLDTIESNSVDRFKPIKVEKRDQSTSPHN